MSADGEQGGVTQADRDAAADLMVALNSSDGLGRKVDAWRKGHFDRTELVQAFMRHRLAHAAPTTGTPDAVRRAVDLAYDLLMEVEQTTSNVWWVNVDDPEVAVSDTLDALEEARGALALANHPTSPEAAA